MYKDATHNTISGMKLDYLEFLVWTPPNLDPGGGSSSTDSPVPYRIYNYEMSTVRWWFRSIKPAPANESSLVLPNSTLHDGITSCYVRIDGLSAISMIPVLVFLVTACLMTEWIRIGTPINAAVGKAEKHAFLFPATPSFESKLKNIVLNKPPTHGAGRKDRNSHWLLKPFCSQVCVPLAQKTIRRP